MLAKEYTCLNRNGSLSKMIEKKTYEVPKKFLNVSTFCRFTHQTNYTNKTELTWYLQTP